MNLPACLMIFHTFSRSSSCFSGWIYSLPLELVRGSVINRRCSLIGIPYQLASVSQAYFSSCISFSRSFASSLPCLQVQQHHPNQVKLLVQLKPSAMRNRIQSVDDETKQLKISIQAAPKDNEANKELIKFVAKSLGLRQDQVTMVVGDKSRDKVLMLSNCHVEEIEERLSKILDTSK